MNSKQTNRFPGHCFFWAILVFGSYSLMVGCATITRGTTDTVQVDVSNCNRPMSCEAKNKKGSWEFIAPGPVTFKKSDDPLNISCKDGKGILTHTIAPSRGAMAWGNVLIGGVIGGGVDASTDAHWDIPDNTVIVRSECES